MLVALLSSVGKEYQARQLDPETMFWSFAATIVP